MVISRCPRAPRNGAWLVAELMIAIAILGVAMIPLAFSFRAEQKIVRTHYQQVVAMEILDGEMELLHAGNWRAFLEGEHPYPVTAAAASNLPPGKFLLKRTSSNLLLQWLPSKRGYGGVIQREIPLFQKAPGEGSVTP